MAKIETDYKRRTSKIEAGLNVSRDTNRGIDWKKE